MVWIEGCQIEVKRYALLDTDFISKTHSVQDDGGNHLIDRVMELPEYEFFCHAQIVTELNRYNADTPIWLSEKIGAQKIKSYTDQEILESLSLVRGPLACATYTQMLKLACDAFSKDYFSEHYQALEEADYAAISREDYLKELERLDIEVGKKNNLGEIKSFVLLQVLSVMLGEQIYVFCSDDKNARNGATNFEDVRCISLVSVFSRLKEESNWTLADAEPYIESLIAFYQDHHQTTFRVMEASEVRRLQQIPCRQVLQEIFEGKFIELKNGMLRYKLGFAIVRENFRKERNDWKLDLRVGEGADAIELEIFAEPNPPKRVNRPEACGLRHLAFRVEDVEATVAELEQMGIGCEPIRLDSYTQKKMTFFFDPDGLPLELHE